MILWKIDSTWSLWWVGGGGGGGVIVPLTESTQRRLQLLSSYHPTPFAHPSTNQPVLHQHTLLKRADLPRSLTSYPPVFVNFSSTGTLLRPLFTDLPCLLLPTPLLTLLLPPSQLPTTTNYYSCPPNSRHSIHFLFLTYCCYSS